ncbi:DUF4365 domain-containing protein [bacterium]|nr:DUF4365 domain-containing protein [bacterium]
MKRTESQKFGEAAEDQFRALITGDHFIPNSRERDYGIDHDVDVVINGQITKFLFHVQVKKCGKPYRRKRDRVRIKIETKSLKHYLKSVLLPVFIVGIDLTASRGYWLFAQQYVVEMDQKKLAQNKGEMTVAIPKKNKLEDHETLLNAVKDAHKFMKKLHPGEVRDAILKSEENLKLLDPRWEYRMTSDRDNWKITCKALEDIHVGFSFKGNEKTREKFKRMIEQGNLAEFDPDEIAIHSLPVLEHKLKETGARLRLDFSGKVDVTLQISTVDRNDHEIRQIGSFKGYLKGGTKVVQLISESNSNPFALSLSIDRLSQTGKSYNIPFQVNSWLGRKLLNLPYFDELRHLYTDLKNGASMKVVCSADEGVIFSAKSGFNEDVVEGFYTLLEMLHRARILAKRFNINPVFKELDLDELLYIAVLHDLLTVGKVTPEYKSVPLSIRKGDLDISKFSTKSEPEDITVGLPPLLPFMGQKVKHGIKGLKMTKVTQATDIESLPNFDQLSDDDPVIIEFRVSEETEVMPEFSDDD